MSRTYDGEERRVHEDGFLSGIPPWVRAIAVVGIPGAIALWVVWIGSNTLPALQKEMTIMNVQVAHTNELLQQNQQKSESLYLMMQRVCSAAARTDEARAACFERR